MIDNKRKKNSELETATQDTNRFYHKSIENGWLYISDNGIVERDIVSTLLDPDGKEIALAFLKKHQSQSLKTAE